MKKIIKSFFVIGVMGVFVLGVTNAFFSDEENSLGNTFVAGAIDLKIDNQSYYNGVLNQGTTWTFEEPMKLFFDFTDVKPDDEGEDTISLHVQNDAYACMSITKTADDDVTCTDPELADDPTCNVPGVGAGELGGLLNFIFWADDGDNVLEADENLIKQGTAANLFDGALWTLADSLTNIWNVGGPMLAEETYYIGKAWCFGNLTPSPLTQDNANNLISPVNTNGGINCDGTLLDNASQTDKFLADIEFSAIQARHNDGFLCNPDEIPECVPGFATGFEQENQGLRKNTTAVLPERSDPNAALGAPQSTGTPTDSPVFGSFYSLGFGSENTPGGSIVLTFANPIVDLAGYDFRVFEVTGGVYPDEKVMVEASQDGSTWHLVTASATRDAFLDLGVTPLSWASNLKITDQSDKSIFEATADAYDLDAVETYCGTQLFTVD